MSRAKNEKGTSKVSVGESASRVGREVYHTGQGQDERARTQPSPLQRGLDSVRPEVSNPHRESGTRWWAAADIWSNRQVRSNGSWSTKGTRREPFGLLRWSTRYQH
jgi:hypothetical protein